MNAVEQMVRAAADGDRERVAGLLGMGVPVDAVNTEHRTALDIAVWARHTDVIRLLVGAGADLQQGIGEYSENTPLGVAVSQGMTEVVRLLLDAGADPDHRLAETRPTALMVAAFDGHAEIVRLLLDRGASTGLERRGKTAREWAAESGRPGALRLLRDHGAASTTEALE